MNLKRRLERLAASAAGAPAGTGSASVRGLATGEVAGHTARELDPGAAGASALRGSATDGAPALARVAQDAGAPASPASAPPASRVVLRSLPEEPSPPAEDRRSRLDELRRHMQALLQRERRPSEVHRRAGLPVEALPFAVDVAPSGRIWRRVERLQPGQRVGRVALAAAGSADAGVLAELALDRSIAEAASERWLFIDTETTGLGGGGALAFLVGMAWLEPAGGVRVEQLLLADPSQELALLEQLRERIDAASLLVSFNGKAFDRPLLEARAVLNRLPAFAPRPHLDLLHVGRRLHHRRLGRCTLEAVERGVLGYDRGEDVDGSEIGPIYSHFLRSGDATRIADVVAHNLWDVLSMVALVGLYGQRMPPLAAQDLAGLARTLERAGAHGHAEHVADLACERGGGADAYRVRAQLAKRRGDCSSAVRDFERSCAEADDPISRLELAKLYEHKLREPARALRWLEQGTNENSLAQERRRERLERKLAVSRQREASLSSRGLPRAR